MTHCTSAHDRSKKILINKQILILQQIKLKKKQQHHKTLKTKQNFSSQREIATVANFSFQNFPTKRTSKITL